MAGTKVEEKKNEGEAVAKAMPHDNDEDSSSEEEDDLCLEGVLIRNAEESSSSDDESDDDDDDSDGESEKKVPAKISKNDATGTSASAKNYKKRETAPSKVNTKKRKKKKRTEGPEIINVEFTFHDYNEKFFHGVKNLLHECSTVYQSHSSAFTDLMIGNIAVGTVCSTYEGSDGNVFGFGSVLNVTTYGDKPCIKFLKKICLDNCPANRKKEMETVLSGKTARPAGFFFHSRMVNMPLEITEVLQNQLVLDMDWAVKNAEGGEAERKSLDFGAFVRLAPAIMDGGALVYRYFEDEIFSTHAEFVYNINAPPSYGSEEKQMVSIVVMTKTGHRAAMKELKQLVGSGGS